MCVLRFSVWFFFCKQKTAYEMRISDWSSDVFSSDLPITAGTLFWIDAGTDTGDIADQQFFHVAPDETAATLYAKHRRALAVMFDRMLERKIGRASCRGRVCPYV